MNTNRARYGRVMVPSLAIYSESKKEASISPNLNMKLLVPESSIVITPLGHRPHFNLCLLHLVMPCCSHNWRFSFLFFLPFPLLL